MALRIVFLIAAAGGLVTGLFVLETYERIPSRPPAPEMVGILTAPPALPAERAIAEREIQQARRQRDALRMSRPYIVVDTHANILYLRSEESIMLRTPCSTGSGGELEDEATGRRWNFGTPLGHFRVESKLVDPWWRKPDWAFLEDSLAVPADPNLRLDSEMLGEYAMGFGNGYYIHGTVYERLLGISVTHGCIRVGSEDLKRLYEKVTIGTPIYIF